MAHDPVGVGQCVSHGCGEAGGRRAGEVQLEQVERSRGEGVLVWSVEAVEAAAAAAAAAAVSTTHGGGHSGRLAATLQQKWKGRGPNLYVGHACPLPRRDAVNI